MIRHHQRPPGRLLAAGLLALGLAAAAPTPAPAKIDLVTLPDRGEIELTIYNNEDLTLVRERRAMSFVEGHNELQFGWANTLIDPTSLHLEILEGGDALDVEDVSYPPNTQNVLIWNIEASAATSGRIEISYFTSGIRWEADYVVKATPDETALAIDGYVRVTNNSGEDYEGAKTRLLVGEVNLVEDIRTLAQQGINGARARQIALGMAVKKAERRMMLDAMAPMAPASAAYEAAAEVKEVAKEGVGEYFLFTIEGTEDITDGLSKRMRSFDATDVATVVTYKQDPERWGQDLRKFYKFKNDKDSHLGLAPLPNGTWQVFRETTDGALAYEGRHDERYVPVDEEVELNLGSDGLVVIEEKRMKFVRENLNFSSYRDVNGYDNVTSTRLTLRNSKTASVPVEIRRHFHESDFDFDADRETRSLWTKIDQNTFELKTTLEALTENAFDYTQRVRTGANATK